MVKPAGPPTPWTQELELKFQPWISQVAAVWKMIPAWTVLAAPALPGRSVNETPEQFILGKTAVSPSELNAAQGIKRRRGWTL